MVEIHVRERELHQQVAERVAAALDDVEVLAVELAGPERLVVYVDRPSGVDHALCARVTGILDDYLEQYALDVSSPGPKRPLRTASHFAGVLGRSVALRTARPQNGRRRFRGEIVAVDDRQVTVVTGGESVAVPYDEIVRANLIDDGGWER